jgi:hypothetical protein
MINQKVKITLDIFLFISFIFFLINLLINERNHHLSGIIFIILIVIHILLHWKYFMNIPKLLKK